MRILAVAVASLTLALTGCTLDMTATPPSAAAGAAFKGSVHGGQQPYINSRVFLLAAGTSGYGGPSVSLLQPGPSTTYDGDISSGTYGYEYLLTDANGGFSITGDYSCTPGSQVYLYVYGGRPAGPNILANTAAGFLAILGNCPTSGTFAPSEPFILVDEVTTIAAAYAFAGFATDALHVSSSGTSLAQTGIANAFANAANLANIATGTALATTPAGNGTVPQATINTLANILAACINSNNDTGNPSGNPRLFSTACLTVVSNATVDGTSTGTQPADMASAAINIAHNPAANLSSLFALASASPPFLPTLATAPNDFAIAVQFAAGGQYSFGNIAIDGSGAAWMTNYLQGTLTKLSASGVLLSGINGFATSPNGTNIVFPEDIAIDTSGNAWVAAGNKVMEMSNTGTVISGVNGYSGGGISNAYYIAVDGLGDAWVTDQSYPNNPVTEISGAGAFLSGTTGYLGGANFIPGRIAFDNSENALVGGNGKIQKITQTGIFSSFSSGSGEIYGIAVDNDNDVWSVDAAHLAEVSSTGAILSGTSGYSGGGIFQPQRVAIDGNGSIWVLNGNGQGHNPIVEVSSTGGVLSGSNGYNGGFTNFLSNCGIAVDGSGNVWTLDCSANLVTQFVGVAAPVVTPLSLGAKNGTLGKRP